MAKLVHKEQSYTGGGSSGLLPHIVITSDAENTITVTTPSGSTITPTSTVSGVWECDGDEYGTYTITATYDEYETEDTVVVDTVKVYTVEIHIVTIPDGSTVLPTDDVATWLLCADIKDKAYTTLSQVLADSETFNALLGDSNACAYMARCEGWAVPALVPVMTSNTTPSGECLYKTEYSTEQAYKAFDGNSGTNYSASSSSANEEYLGYKFTTPTVVRALIYQATNQANCENTWQVEYSDDEVTWTSTGDTFKPTTPTKWFVPVTHDNTPHQCWRINAIQCDASTYKSTTKLQFLAIDVTLTTNQYAMSMLGQYDVCCDALLGNATWASAIASSAYADYVCNIIVPKMTSATTPSGTVAVSSEVSPFEGYKAFDRSTSTGWISNAGASSSISYTFTSPHKVKYIVWEQGGNGHDRDFNAISILAKNGLNTQSWAYTKTVTQTFENGVHIIEIDDNDTAYDTWAVSTTNNSQASSSNGYTPYFLELQFIGHEDSGEYIHGTNNESAYYLDGATQTPIVDPSTLSAGTYTFGSTKAKNPSDLTADYTKTIRITPNTKEIVLRPDNALYWWGYESANLEDLSTANGWNWNYTFTAPTHQTYGIIMQGFSDYGMQGVGGKTNYNVHSVKTICESVSAPSGYAQLALQTSKNISDGSATISAVDMVNGLSTITSDSLAYIRVESAGANNTVTLKAFWYE